MCASCYNKWIINKNPENRKKALERQKKHYNAQKFTLSKEEWSLLRRKSHLKSRYNLTYEEYETRILEQQNKCSICHQKFKSNHHIYVDHDHETNKIRDLLCPKCNNRVGAIEMTTKNEQLNLIKYLKKHNSSTFNNLVSALLQLEIEADKEVTVQSE